MSDSPILVTGAGGFVCSEVALAMQRSGKEVVATDMHFDATTTERLRGVRCLEGPLQEIFTEGGIGPVSAVIHGAAITASPERLGLTNAEHIRRNMDLLTAALAFAAQAGAGRFLFLSSMGVFEPHDAPAPGGRFNEATVPTAACTYCMAKRAGELLVVSAAEEGFATQSVRLGNIFGPHEAVRESRQHLCLVSRMIAEARENSEITINTPDALREWSWLPDLSDGIVALLAALLPGAAPVLHAGSPPVIEDIALARSIMGRIPGSRLRPMPPPHDAIRPPMRSSIPSAFDQVAWTGIEAALDMLIAKERVT